MRVLLLVFCFLQMLVLLPMEQEDSEKCIGEMPHEIIALIASFLTDEHDLHKTIIDIRAYAIANKQLYKAIIESLWLSEHLAQKYDQPCHKIELLLMTPRIKKWLKKKFKKYNQADASGKEAILERLISDESLELLAYFFNKGVDINGYAQTQTPLGIAVNRGKSNCIDFLIKLGADLNQRDALGRTPVFYLSARGDLQKELVKQVLEKKPDLTVADHQYHTPLDLAILKDDIMLVKLLVKFGPVILQPVYETDRVITVLDTCLSKISTNPADYTVEILIFLSYRLSQIH